MYIDTYNSPIGKITMAGNENALMGLWIDGQVNFASSITGETIVKDQPIFHRTKQWLDIYFSGQEPNFIPTLQLVGTDFRKSVWDILRTIPYGKTISYNEISRRIAKARGIKRMSPQAVGGAVGHNPISIIVPCHRVIGSDGSMTGYAGGIDKKKYLLSLEKAEAMTKR